MSKETSSRDKARQDALERFKQFWNEEERRRSSEEDSYAAQEALCRRARAAFFVNTGSSGQASFDAVMEALLSGGDPTGAWTTPIVLLPPLSRQREVAMMVDDSPPPSRKRPRDDDDEPEESEEPKAPKPKRPKAAATKKKAPAKKPKAKSSPSEPKSTVEEAPSAAAKDEERLGFSLASSTPSRVRKDLYDVFNKAVAAQKEPYMLAYPWVGVRLWYNPARYPDVYLAHWRFWNVCRPVMWQCAMHPPFPSGAAQARFRKKKMRACQKRLGFMSICIETWGFVAFLELLHVGCTQLLWLGGRPGRRSPKAPKSGGELDQDLGTLYFTDRPRYKRRVAAALDPANVDQEGYASVAEFLEQTTALNADVDSDGRLSDGALARVRADWVSNRRFRSPWKTEALVEAYEKLRDHARISSIDAPDQQGKPYVYAYCDWEPKRKGSAPFKKANGAFSALAPSSGGIVVYPTPRATSATRRPAPASSSPVSTPAVTTLKVNVTNAELVGEEDSSADETSDKAGDEEAKEAHRSDRDDTSNGDEAVPSLGGDVAPDEVDGSVPGGRDGPREGDDEEKHPAPVRSSTKSKASTVRTLTQSKATTVRTPTKLKATTVRTRSSSKSA